MTRLFAFYLESNLVCLVIFALMLGHNLLNVDRQEKQIKYDRALLMFMLYFIVDTFWAAILYGTLPMSRGGVVAVNFADYILMAAITYSWLEYVMAVEQTPYRNEKRIKYAMLFPFLIATVALVAVYLIKPEVLLNEALEIQPLFPVFLIGVPCIYITAVLVYTIRKAIEEDNPGERKKHLYIGLFPLMVVFGGIIQLALLPEYPIFCFCCTVLMLMVYVQSMETQISMDPLTGLNNRGQLNRYISQKSGSYRKDRGNIVIMVDVNDFKKINDNYGHEEGDRALILVADALRDVARNHGMPIFLSRYGGDEFVLIVHPEIGESIEPLIEEIRRGVESRCRDNETPYTLTVSIGFDELTGPEDSFQKSLRRADEKMYLEKEKRKNSGAQNIKEAV